MGRRRPPGSTHPKGPPVPEGRAPARPSSRYGSPPDGNRHGGRTGKGLPAPHPAAIEGVGRSGYPFRVVLELGRHLDHFRPVGEPAGASGGDSDRDGHEREPLPIALAILRLDEPTGRVLWFV